MRPAGLPQPGLVHVRVKVSGVISAPLAPVWGIVRSFANLGSWLEPVNGASMRTELLRGHSDNQIGCVRVVSLSGHHFAEQLEALDDLEHVQKYRLISHPGASNPFPYAFLNYHSVLCCKSITVGNMTFMEWSGAFDTVPEGMEEMHNMIEDHITSGFNGLRSRMARKSQAPPLIASGPSITVASPGYSYSQTQSHHFHSNSPAAQSNPLLNTGLMPGGPIDMFMSTTSEPGSTSRRSQFVSPSLLNVSRGSNLSGGSTASQHSQVSHRSEVPSDVHGQTRLSYHEPPEVKNRSQGL